MGIRVLEQVGGRDGPQIIGWDIWVPRYVFGRNGLNDFGDAVFVEV